MYVCMNVCMSVRTYVCTSVCMYVCMYIHIYVCMQSNGIYGEVHMKNIVIAMMNESVSVKGIDGNYMLLKDVLTFEGIPRVIIEKLFEQLAQLRL